MRLRIPEICIKFEVYGNLATVLALVTSSGKEFHGLVTCCVRKNFLLVVLVIVTDPPF